MENKNWFLILKYKPFNPCLKIFSKVERNDITSGVSSVTTLSTADAFNFSKLSIVILLFNN